MKRFKNILCVMESEAACLSALTRAVALAQSNQAAVTVVMAAEPVKAGDNLLKGRPSSSEVQDKVTAAQTRWLQTLIAPYREQVDINVRVLIGTPFLEIIREVLRNGHDLVIKCPEPPDWLNRLFASDDMHLLRKCPCPVWLVKPESGQSYQRILAAVDVNDNYPPAELSNRQALNRLVMEIAASLAVSEFAELHVVHTWEAFGESAVRHGGFIHQTEDEINAYVQQVQHHHTRCLEALIQEAGAKLGRDAMEYLDPQLHLLKGAARREIPALAERLQVDCIVMGTVARTGIRGLIMGNTAETILEQIACSVLALKPPGFVTPVELEG